MIKAPIIYTPSYIAHPHVLLNTLQTELAWVRRETTPRSEYYINKFNTPYAYKVGKGTREYLPQPTHYAIEEVFAQLKATTGVTFDVCFLNRYHNQSDHLGWHSDNSPEMDDARPIAIISLGVEREIWFRPMECVCAVCKAFKAVYGMNHVCGPEAGCDGLCMDMAAHGKPILEVVPLKLEHGSLCLMEPGMQDTHMHRIPKAGFSCHERVSLTFRGYVAP